MVNYAERHRAGLRVGTAITEATANFLVNRRMNKAQQMRWSRRGAYLLLQVRCAIYNGTLGSGFGRKFHSANDTYPASGGCGLTPNPEAVPWVTTQSKVYIVAAIAIKLVAAMMFCKDNGLGLLRQS
jgi:hypothetical protein